MDEIDFLFLIKLHQKFLTKKMNKLITNQVQPKMFLLLVLFHVFFCDFEQIFKEFLKKLDKYKQE